MQFAVLALAMAAFAIGTSEFLVVGLLGLISHDLGISVADAGSLVSLYAAAVTLGAPLVAAFTSRLLKNSTAPSAFTKVVGIVKSGSE